MQKLIALISLIFICTTSLYAGLKNVWADNTSPDRGLIGFQIGGGLLFGGNGEMFNDPSDIPHGEFALLGGGDYWVKINRSYNISLSVLLNYHQSHFHVVINNAEYDGYYRHLFLNIPFAFEFPIPKYPYLAFRIGIGFNTTNLLRPYNSEIIGFNYQTKVYNNWLLSPDFLIGFSILEEETPRFHLRAMVQYAVQPFKGLRHDSTMDFFGGGLNHSGAMDIGRALIILGIYPKWKKKYTVNQNKDCPIF